MASFPYASSLGAYDPGKFANPTSPKYIFLNLAAQHGVSTPEQQQALLNALHAHPSGYFANATLNGDILGGLTDPAFNGISSFDVVRDYGGANGISWQPQGGASASTTSTQGIQSTAPVAFTHDQQEEGESVMTPPQFAGKPARNRIMEELALRQSLQSRMY